MPDPLNRWVRVASDGTDHRVTMPDGTLIPGVLAVHFEPLRPGRPAVVRLEMLASMDVTGKVNGDDG